MFRLLGLSPGPDISPSAAASLAGLPWSQTPPVLAELAQAHLLTEPTPDRLALHDLLRAYATELTETIDTDADRHEALLRLLDHYLHTAHGAAQRLAPHRGTIRIPAPRPGVTPEPLADHDRALAWYTAECRVLLAAVEAARTARADRHVWQLAWALATFLDRRGQWSDLATTHITALAATERLNDCYGQAVIHRYLARAYVRLERVDDADAHYRRARDLFAQLGEHAGQAHTHLDLAWVYERQHRYRDALRQAQRALDLYRLTGDRGWQARALNAIGWYHALLGDHRDGLPCCEEALALLTDIEDRNGQAATCDSLGYIHHHLGDHPSAVAQYERALRLRQELGDRYNEAETLTHLGDAHQAAGDLTRARRAWREALVILDELQHSDADRLRGRLRA
jgi:tetratricopeptide (TPR) repeat protein